MLKAAVTALKRRAIDRSFSGPMHVRIRHARRLASLTQAALAGSLRVAPSAVAQWETPKGTCPTIDHLSRTAVVTGVAFEWLATGRGRVGAEATEVVAVETATFAADELEERLLGAFRHVPARRREAFVRWLEEVFV